MLRNPFPCRFGRTKLDARAKERELLAGLVAGQKLLLERMDRMAINTSDLTSDVSSLTTAVGLLTAGYATLESKLADASAANSDPTVQAALDDADAHLKEMRSQIEAVLNPPATGTGSDGAASSAPTAADGSDAGGSAGDGTTPSVTGDTSSSATGTPAPVPASTTEAAAAT